ncbi:hypothetical protein BUALT_Bualt02G0249400 [Buddleja alternifolia]|uniref:Chromo domain-containing protein n=1 Tax=Buddleja alternifolia TaxID=168488 RepID=A0AAV6Y4C0_9LAMI|nr:hypothetical protein BUALT_Bualt02G0249400 [Buddleja alternifolia]
MSGKTDLNTLRVKGTSYKKDIQVLIDSGSTNCFLDEKMSRKLGCKLTYTTPTMVSVADGNKIVSRTICEDFCWAIHGHTFFYPIRVIKMGGSDMVLGEDWLRKHSPIEFEYDKMRITISQDGKMGTYGLLGQLFSVTMKPIPEFKTDSKLSELLDEFEEVFSEPKELLPDRNIQHQINLKPSMIPKKLAPYRKHLKLSLKYYMPYLITEKLGKVAYRLALLEGSAIHSVFHVSLLKKKIGQTYTPVQELPEINEEGFCKTYHVFVLSRRIILRNNAPVTQFLIQWVGFSENEATWEDFPYLKRQFLDFDPQNRRGNVMNLEKIGDFNEDRRIKEGGGSKMGRWIKDLVKKAGNQNGVVPLIR